VPQRTGVPRGGVTAAVPPPGETGGLPPVPAGPRFGPARDRVAPRNPTATRSPTAIPDPTATRSPAARDHVPPTVDHPRPLPAPRPAPPPPPTGVEPGPGPEPETTPTRRPRRRAGWTAGTVVLVGAAAAAAVALVPLPWSGPTGAAAPTIVLDPPVQDGDTVRLTWTGPDDLDYSVTHGPGGTEQQTALVGRSRTTTLPLSPGAPHCFQVLGSDARAIHPSNVQPLNGAYCGG